MHLECQEDHGSRSSTHDHASDGSRIVKPFAYKQATRVSIMAGFLHTNINIKIDLLEFLGRFQPEKFSIGSVTMRNSLSTGSCQIPKQNTKFQNQVITFPKNQVA